MSKPTRKQSQERPQSGDERPAIDATSEHSPGKIPAAMEGHKQASPSPRPDQTEQDAETKMQSLLSKYRQYLQKETTMPKIALDLGISRREVIARLREAFRAGAIEVHTPESTMLRDRMNLTWRGPTYHVLNALDEPTFFSAAADVFFFELDALLRKRSFKSDNQLHIGIVGGQTTGGMIEALCGPPSWQNRFKSDSLPKAINVYALNVSQTSGYDELRGNANILAFQLARKLQHEFPRLTIDVLGLSTDLLQVQEDARRSDTQPQTRRVLEHTDPTRLRKSLESEHQPVPPVLPQESELDIVITGVGSIKSSLFKDYCEESGFDPDGLARNEKIVGDIAYCPVDLFGGPRQLRREDKEFVFYSAVSLDVLTRMSESQYKKVILVARNAGDRKKVDPIHAAIGGDQQHCNVLITDHLTADELLKRHGRPSD